jgi:uncharacterized protein (TIGR01777 family)
MPDSSSVQSTIILAGGSGFIGRNLYQGLASRYFRISILSRSQHSVSNSSRKIYWDGKTSGEWCSSLEGSLAVINLSGRSVHCRHTKRNRNDILNSRTDSVKAIGRAIESCVKPPKVWIQAGSVGYYGDTRQSLCTEESPPGTGTLSEISRAWEEAFQNFRFSKTRQVLLRIGPVLGKDGGILETLKPLVHWFLGGTAGSGKQGVSWIHQTDLKRIVMACIENRKLSGIYNAVSPNPVSNDAFMRSLRRALNRPWSPPVPALLVRPGAFIMGTSADLVLQGACCIPERLSEAGFRFQFVDLDSALEDLLPDKAKRRSYGINR